jgi:carbonic anhydrase
MNAAQMLLLQNKSWVQEKLSLDPEYFTRFATGQQPEFLWLGCSDSRLAVNDLTATGAGEIFVHRNVANLFVESDTNAQAVLQYAVETLQVRHVIVCGHYGCGGVRAAIEGARGEAAPIDGALGTWLANIRSLVGARRGELEKLSADQRWDRVVELNTIAQVEQLRLTAVIQRAWARGAGPSLHAWVYRVGSGVLSELLAVEAEAGRLATVASLRVP